MAARGCCFSVLFHRRDEVYFETKTIFFSRDFGAARVLTQLITAGLSLSFYAAAAPKLCSAKSNRGGRALSVSPALFGIAFGASGGLRDFSVRCRADEMF